MLCWPDDNPWLSEGQKSNPLLLPKDLLLIIFIHGFKGSESTFSDFPGMLQRIVANNNSDLDVESIVFPTYSNDAVGYFTGWLTALVKEKEIVDGEDRAARKVKVVLCGHSMGGLIAVDTLIGVVASRKDKETLLWPRIIACIAMDTPYFGLSPLDIGTKVVKAIRYAHSARQAPSTMGTPSDSPPVTLTRSAEAAVTTSQSSASGLSWATWATQTVYAAGGLLLSGAAAGAEFYKRDNIEAGYKWAKDHMKYVGTLWDGDNLSERMKKLTEIEDSHSVAFRNFYTLVPGKFPDYFRTRMFIALPPNKSSLNSKFLLAQNNIAEDEIQAHTGMFKPNTNDGYHRLGFEVEEIIRGAIDSSNRIDNVEDLLMTFNSPISLLYSFVR
ncbi:hypothetical protein M0805_006571 [Coniferiporia weirii]|nr:hypothetical protein M0805_006571 [Coniferiporia weirii]